MHEADNPGPSNFSTSVFKCFTHPFNSDFIGLIVYCLLHVKGVKI